MASAADEKAALRAWVTAQDDKSFTQSPPGWVRIEITSDLLRTAEMTANNWQNFALSTPLPDFKAKLQLTVGTAPVHQRLHVFDARGRKVAVMDNDNLCLGHYGIQDGWMVQVEDVDPFRSVARLQDYSEAPKYVMSDEEYRARKGTFREWKLQNPEEYMKHFGHLHPDQQKALDAIKGTSSTPAAARTDETGAEEAARITVGMRARIVGDRRGTVAYVGPVAFAKGHYVGINLDEPVGKHDGEVKGKRYFQADPMSGVMVPAEEVEVGDFPPLGLGDDDEI
jgi:tubulin-folding cofactor B